MKKYNLAAVITLLISSTLFTACKKEDSSPPVVTLNGLSRDTISLQGVYNELGATAEDLHDGSLSPTATGTVNVNLKGTYTILYSVMDAAGNLGTNSRAITVVNDLDYLTGTYRCSILGTPPYNFLQGITASTTVNNRIVYSKFSDYAGNASIYADFDGSNLTIPNQTAIQVGPNGSEADRTFEGSGTITDTGFTINYTETEGTNVTSISETQTKK